MDDSGLIVIVKIGVALSGCDIGGICAFDVLRELEEEGLAIGMVSACGLPSVAALLYASGYDTAGCRAAAKQFLREAREIDLDMAVAELAAQRPLRKGMYSLPLVVSSVNVSDGRICAFTDDFALSTGRLHTFPLEDPYDVLSAAISPVEGLASYGYAGCQLCDFSVWYGCPVYPLKMAGFDRIISIAFLPKYPRTPYEVLVKQRITASSHLADIHIPIELDLYGSELGEYIDSINQVVTGSMEQICMKALF